jgi:hypothetical protein
MKVGELRCLLREYDEDDELTIVLGFYDVTRMRGGENVVCTEFAYDSTDEFIERFRTGDGPVLTALVDFEHARDATIDRLIDYLRYVKWGNDHNKGVLPGQRNYKPDADDPEDWGSEPD